MIEILDMSMFTYFFKFYVKRCIAHNFCKIIDHSRLEKKLNQTDSEYHGLLADISLLLRTSMRSPDLQQKSDDLKEIWHNLKELTQVKR